MAEESGQRVASRSLREALAACRDGDVSRSRVSRFSDLSRDEARAVADAWQSLPEGARADIVRRCDELSEERIDLDFRRLLRIALDDPSPVVRQLAVAGLWEDDSRDMLGRLRRLLADDESVDVRAAAAAGLERFARQASLGELNDAAAKALREDLLTAANDETTPYVVRRRALEALGPYGDESQVAAAIRDAYDSGDHGLQCSAIYAMGRSQDRRWLPDILAELESEDPEVRFEAARSAGALGSADALPLLLDVAHDEDAEVRHAAIGTIAQIGGRGAVRALERLAEDAGEADLELIESALDEVQTLLDPFQPGP